MPTLLICLAMGWCSVAGFILGNYYVYYQLKNMAYERLLARREQFIKEQLSAIDHEYESLLKEW